MKAVRVKENTKEKRRYTHWMRLVEEFHRSRSEVWKMYREEDGIITEQEFNLIVNALRSSVRRSGYAIYVVKRGNDVFMIKTIKVELVDF